MLKKKTTKKAAAKKTTTKKKLIKAPDEQCFFVHNGPAVRDLKDLAKALKSTISDEQYAHHANGRKNDFSMWIHVVLQDPECAKVLARVKTRKTAATKIENCLKKYK